MQMNTLFLESILMITALKEKTHEKLFNNTLTGLIQFLWL